MTSPKEYRQFALECGKQAVETNDERLREILNETARMWMRVGFAHYHVVDHAPA